MSDRTRKFGKQAQDAIEKAILSAFVDANGGPLTIAETARSINVHEHNNLTTDRTLRKLEEEGIVKQLGKGQPFVLTDEGRRKCGQLFGQTSVLLSMMDG